MGGRGAGAGPRSKPKTDPPKRSSLRNSGAIQNAVEPGTSHQARHELTPNPVPPKGSSSRKLGGLDDPLTSGHAHPKSSHAPSGRSEAQKRGPQEQEVGSRASGQGQQKNVVRTDDMSALDSRLSFSFWKKPKLNVADGGEEVLQGNLLISDLYIGKHFRDLTVRVTLTSPKSNPNVFKFYAFDGSGEIEVVSFGREVMRFGLEIQLNGTYAISNFDVKDATTNPKYPSGTGNVLVIHTSHATTLKEVHGVTLPPIPFQFSDIANVARGDIPLNTEIDVIAIVTQVWPRGKTANGKYKRDFSVTDEHKSEVIVTIWGEHASQLSLCVGDIVALRRVAVGDHNGRKLLNAFHNTLVWLDPDLPGNEVDDLRAWFLEETA